MRVTFEYVHGNMVWMRSFYRRLEEAHAQGLGKCDLWRNNYSHGLCIRTGGFERAVIRALNVHLRYRAYRGYGVVKHGVEVVFTGERYIGDLPAGRDLSLRCGCQYQDQSRAAMDQGVRKPPMIQITTTFMMIHVLIQSALLQVMQDLCRGADQDGA